jgi:hypothetical protein
MHKHAYSVPAFTLPIPTVVSVARSVSDCTIIKSASVALPAA